MSQKSKLNLNKNSGASFVVASSLCFSLYGVCVKYIPWSPMAIDGLRNFAGAIIFGLYLLITKHKLVFNKSVISGICCMWFTGITFAYANKLTTSGNAIILQFTAPIWIVLYSLLISKKKVSRLELVSVICAFVGVIFFFLDSIAAGNMLGNIIALASGIGYAGVFMMGEKEDGDVLSSVFGAMIVTAIIGIPWIVTTDFAATTGTTWIAFAILALVSTGIGHLAFALGISTTTGIVSSLMSGLEPVLNPTWVALIYGETLGPLSLVGAVIVLLTIITYNVASAKIQSKEGS